MSKITDKFIDKLMEVSEAEWHSTMVTPPMWASDDPGGRVYRSQTLLIALRRGEFVIGWFEMRPEKGDRAGLAEVGWAYNSFDFGFAFLKRDDILAWLELPKLPDYDENEEEETK